MRFNRFLGLLAILIIFSTCTTTTKVTYTRSVATDIPFCEDEYIIYDLVTNIILIRNPVRVETVGEYSIQELLNNSDSIERRTIDTEIVVLKDITTIPSLRRDITFENQMDSSINYIIRNSDESYREVAMDFKNKNIFDYSLEEYISSNSKIESLDTVIALMGETSPSDYWNKFYTVKPNACGRMAFSRVGFNNERNKAIIEVQYIKGLMNGFIDYLFLIKEDEWKVENSVRKVRY